MDMGSSMENPAGLRFTHSLRSFSARQQPTSSTLVNRSERPRSTTPHGESLSSRQVYRSLLLNPGKTERTSLRAPSSEAHDGLDGHHDLQERINPYPMDFVRNFSLTTEGEAEDTEHRSENGPPLTMPRLRPPLQNVLATASSSVASLSSSEDQDRNCKRCSKPRIKNYRPYYYRDYLPPSPSNVWTACSCSTIEDHPQLSENGRHSFDSPRRTASPPLSHIGLQRSKTTASDGRDVHDHPREGMQTVSISSLERELFKLQSDVNALKAESAKRSHGGPGPSNLRFSMAANPEPDTDTASANSTVPARTRSKIRKVKHSKSVDFAQTRSSRKASFQPLGSSPSGATATIQNRWKDARGDAKSCADDTATIATSRWSPDSDAPRRNVFRRAGLKFKHKVRSVVRSMRGARKGTGHRKDVAPWVDGFEGEKQVQQDSVSQSKLGTLQSIAYLDTRTFRREFEDTNPKRNSWLSRPSMRWLRRRPPPPDRPATA